MQCPLCLVHGRNSQLQTYQINLTEAIQLCEQPKCSFPLGANGDHAVETFNRDLCEVEASSVRKVATSGPSKSQLALQAKACWRLQTYGQREQNSVSAIQTGSPELFPRRCKPLVAQDNVPQQADRKPSGRKSRASSENGVIKDSRHSLFDTRTQTGKSGLNGCHENGLVKKRSLQTGEIGTESGRRSRQALAGRLKSGRQSRVSVESVNGQPAGSLDSSKCLLQNGNNRNIPSRQNFTVGANARKEFENGVQSREEFDDWLKSIVGTTSAVSDTRDVKNGSTLKPVDGSTECVRNGASSRNSSNSNYERFQFGKTSNVAGEMAVNGVRSGASSRNSSNSNYERFQFGKTSNVAGEVAVNGAKLKQRSLVDEIIGKVNVKGSLLEKLGGRKGQETPLTDLSRCYNGVAEGLSSLTIPNIGNGAQRIDNVSQVNGDIYNNGIQAVNEKMLQQGSAGHNGAVINTCSQYPSVFPQWTNVDALCWLDVILCLLVHNVTLSRLVFSEQFDNSCVIYKLLKAHEQAKILCDQLSSVSKSADGTSRGRCSSPSMSIGRGKSRKNTVVASSPIGENHPSLSSSLNNTTTCIETDETGCVDVDPSVTNGNPADDDARLYKMRTVLDGVRDDVCAGLRAGLRWEKGQDESPVFAFPLLLRDNPAMEKMFRMSYRFEFSCPRCRQNEVTHHQNVLPTLPGTVKDFNIQIPTHARKCFRCGCLDGRRSLVYQKLPPCVMMHFADGLPELPWSELQFGFHGNQYVVTGCVQYVKSPDHFIAWLRNPHDNTWMKCDDLEGNVCTFSARPPSFSEKQIHIIMWERTQGNVAHAISNGNKVLKHSNQNVCQNARGSEMAKNNTQLCSLLQKQAIADPSQLLQKRTITEQIPLLQKRTIAEQSPSLQKQDPSKQKQTIADNLSKQKQTIADNVNIAHSRKVPASFKRQLSNRGNLQPMSASRQQMVDPHRFLTSSILLPASAWSPTAMDSPGSDTSDVETLPKFVNEVVVTDSQILIRPVPCKTGSDSSTAANCETVYRTLNMSMGKMSVKKSKVNGAIRELSGSKRSAKNSMSKCRGDVIEGDETSSVIMGPVVPIKPSSVFHSVKSAAGSIVDRDSSERPKSDVDGVANDSFEGVSRNQTTMDAGGSPSVDGSQTDNSSDTVTIATDKRGNSSHTADAKFKRPLGLSYFMKKSKPTSNLSKDAFKVLNMSGNDRKPSISSTANGNFNPTIPVLNGNVTYLSSVKQYLIGKATGVPEPKAKFEGLNLKSAPNMNRSLNLAGLKLSSSTPDSLCSFDSQHSVSPVASEFFGRKELHLSSSRSVSSDKSRGRKRKLNGVETTGESPTLKKKRELSNISNNLKLESSRSVNGHSESVGQRAKSGNSSKLNNSAIAYNGKDGNIRTNISMNGHNQAGTCSGDTNGLSNGRLTSDSIGQHVQLKNGLSNVRLKSENVDQHVKSETDSNLVLQDLYEALNIPFGSAKDTMSDIMNNVNDIIGVVDISDIVSSSPLKYSGSGSPRKCGAGTPLKCGSGTQLKYGTTGCGVENQNSLDCWHSMMTRFSFKLG